MLARPSVGVQGCKPLEAGIGGLGASSLAGVLNPVLKKRYTA